MLTQLWIRSNTIWIQITSVVKLMTCWEQFVNYSTRKALDVTLAYMFSLKARPGSYSLQVVCLCNCQSSNSWLKLHTVAQHILYRFRYLYWKHAIFNGALCATWPETGSGYLSSAVSFYKVFPTASLVWLG